MKRIFTIIALAFSFVLSASLLNRSAAQGGVGVNITYQDFYDELSPYGQWVDYPEYGYVWVPSAGPDFQPYQTNGHWVWSDQYDWMWVSDYDWGWAPFHYGRWFNDPGYGWMWMPGYEWSPAWVAWRDGGDYYGWAPLRPGINIGINFSIGSYNPPVNYWCFAPRRYISSPRIFDYCMPRRNNVTIINNTTIINNYGRRGGNNTFVTGPRRRDAERYAGRINPVRFRESNSPGRTRLNGNQVSVYRPNIRRDDNRQFAPRQAGAYDRNTARNGNTIRRNEATDRRNGRIGEGNTRQQGANDRTIDRRISSDRNANNTPGSRNNIDTRNNRSTDRPGDNDRRINRNDNTPRTEIPRTRTLENRNNRTIDRGPGAERPERQSPIRMERERGQITPQGNRPQRIERTERQNAPRMERQSTPRMEQRQSAPRMERQSAPRMERQSAPRMERQSAPRMERQSGPRMERQSAPRMESRSRESRPNNGGGGPSRGGSRRDR